MALSNRNPHHAPGAPSSSRNPSPPSNFLRPPTSGRRVSFIAFVCAVPFLILVILWQHVQLMTRLDGGGEYAAFYDTSGSSSSVSESWGDSIQQVVDVVKFVAYGSGLLAEGDEEYDDDDNNDDENDDISTIYNVKSSKEENSGSIIPFDLSVNHLKLIKEAPGKPPKFQPSNVPLPLHAPNSNPSISIDPAEDFLPVVLPTELTFRWRHHPKVGSSTNDAEQVTAYRIIVRRFIGSSDYDGDDVILWDSGKVTINEGEELPNSVRWHANASNIGTIVQWRVTIFDNANNPHSSIWSKVAIGPRQEKNDKNDPMEEFTTNDWVGKWIAHPVDMETFNRNSQLGNSRRRSDCDRWKSRRALPMFRAHLSAESLENLGVVNSLASALLVVSGLGSFRVSIDGVPLSSSGPVDPPFTDYSKRVSYRGFDVTRYVGQRDDSGNFLDHVIGITMGSGWWDHRPITGGLAKFDLLPRGPATVVAQLYLTTVSGVIYTVIPTAGDDGGENWQVSRGHILESDLFTGEMVDLNVLSTMEGWDTYTGWNIPSVEESNSRQTQSSSGVHQWVSPVPYHTDVTPKAWWEEISVKAQAMTPRQKTAETLEEMQNYASPIGKLIPSEVPPVLPMERIAPEEVHDLGSGRWLFDFGKAFSGMLRFQGLPVPIVPADSKYPRAHGFNEATSKNWPFVSVIYGESLEMYTGDINRVLVAGLGMHDGGPRHISNTEERTQGVPCFPEDQDGTLSQRDVYFISKTLQSNNEEVFSLARQSHFTTHAFRFAEVCCTAEPPIGVHALLYRTAVDEWGSFQSSNVLINGGYELVKNAMKSNILSVQSDCPHREKLPYGGDLVADSPAALHMFDMSSFYKKTVRDWIDAQWDNGAYTETSIWQDLNDYAGIGRGAGETVWASAPPVLSVRHHQYYGDYDLINETLPSHIKWLQFLEKNFDEGMKERGYDEQLNEYDGDGSGLGDWLALRGRDTYLTHTAFYMAVGRAVAYLARQVDDKSLEKFGMSVAKKVQERIVHLYLTNGKENFDFPKGSSDQTPGPEMSLFSRIVPGKKRCTVLKNWFKRRGSLWPGDEEKLFLKELNTTYTEELKKTGELTNDNFMSWSQWQGFGEGIFAIRYAMKTLSDMGFHHIALRKATGFGFGTIEYMLRHNATTMWESWWRSEDLYSRNHPMLGAVAEWMSSSVAGLSLFPTTTGGKKALFWPRFPKSAAMLDHASAVQGTPLGDFSVAWRFENLPSDKSLYSSALVKVRIRILIPPHGKGVLRLPLPVANETKVSISSSSFFPDLVQARIESELKCNKRRNRRMGFPFSWEYDREKREWYKFNSGKSIGTPCESFLFSVLPLSGQWSSHEDITGDIFRRRDRELDAGMYDVIINNWQLEPEIEGRGRIGDIPEYNSPVGYVGPYCEDSDTWEWNVDDATHFI